MTTYGTARLRRSLNNQCSAGETAYTMELDAMEDLVREVEDERDGLIGKCDYWMGRCAELMEPRPDPLASDGKPLRIGETVWRQDGRAFTVEGVGPEFVWGRAEGRVKHNRLLPEWLTHEEPDSWERVERDAATLDGARRSLMREAGFSCDLIHATDLVARCKRLAGVGE